MLTLDVLAILLSRVAPPSASMPRILPSGTDSPDSSTRKQEARGRECNHQESRSSEKRLLIPLSEGERDLKLNSQNSLGSDGILESLYLNCPKIEVKGFIHSTAGYWRGSEIVSGMEWLGAIILERNG